MGFFMQFIGLCLTLHIPIGYGKPPSKILGGMNVMPGEIPYQVSIRLNSRHICGGSIIDELHILTAAHCIFNPNGTVNTHLKVLTGTIDQSNETSGEIHNVQRLFFHKLYDPSNSNANDIAMLKLTKPIVFGWHQQPISLPVINEFPPSAKIVTSGWGYVTMPPSYIPKFLQKLIVHVVDHKQCQSHHARIVHFDQLCVLAAEKRKGLCIYDSGSPLVYAGQLVGIVSWGLPCALGVPDVTLRVYNYVPWIKAVIEKL